MKLHNEMPNVHSLPGGTYVCQFCAKESPVTKWKDGTKCPECGREYDAQRAQDSEG